MQLTFSGGVTVEQEHDILSGENLNAFLNQQKRLETGRDQRQRIHARHGSRPRC